MPSPRDAAGFFSMPEKMHHYHHHPMPTGPQDPQDPSVIGQISLVYLAAEFYDGHPRPLSMLRHGELLHAATEVCSQIVSGLEVAVNMAVALERSTNV